MHAHDEVQAGGAGVPTRHGTIQRLLSISTTTSPRPHDPPPFFDPAIHLRHNSRFTKRVLPRHQLSDLATNSNPIMGPLLVPSRVLAQRIEARYGARGLVRVAQRQSVDLWSRRSWVRFPLRTPVFVDRIGNRIRNDSGMTGRAFPSSVRPKKESGFGSFRIPKGRACPIPKSVNSRIFYE